MTNKKKTSEGVETALTMETSFTKEQLLKSHKYSKYKDVLNVVLEDKEYTLSDVDKEIERFKKKEVKIC